MVSPDEIQHVRSKSERLPSECWREENIFSQSVRPMISVAVSKLGKRDLVFVQPGVKINSVYCCENVLEQGLLPAIRRISNNDLMFKQDGVPYTPFTTLLLTCIHAFQCAWLHWTWKLAAEVQSTSIFRGLFSVDSVVADSVMSQNFRHWSAEASSDQLLGSAEPGHTEPSDWSAAKKTEDGYQGKGWSCWILLGLTICSRDRPCFTVFRMKIAQNSCVIVKFNAILGVLTIYAN